MNRKNIAKIILDTLMLATLVLLYNKRTISMRFHELGGLILLGVFLIHVLINGKWVGKVTSRLFCKGTKPAVRIMWVVDALLLVSFTVIGVTGVLISKTLFSFSGGGQAKLLHYFFAALSIILMGVHLGLHARFAGNVYKRVLRLPKRAAQVLAIVLVVGLTAYGAYSLKTTSFTQWLTGPVRMMTAQQSGGGMGEAAHDGHGKMEGRGNADGSGKGMNGHGGEMPSVQPVQVAAQFLGEMVVFAVLTAGIARAGTALKKKRAAKE